MDIQVDTFIVEGDGVFPGSLLPLLVYRDALELDSGDLALTFEQRFKSNNWGNSWRNGIYSYHHYHSTAHEVLGVYSGGAEIQFGGDTGIACEVKTGDLVIIPAGVAHKKIKCGPEFGVVGAYPDGTCPDLCRAGYNRSVKIDQNIACLALPSADPIYGISGPLITHWYRSNK